MLQKNFSSFTSVIARPTRLPIASFATRPEGAVGLAGEWLVTPFTEFDSFWPTEAVEAKAALTVIQCARCFWGMVTFCA
tara:strand:+ start:1636 stop:1872 length:237 start_codon:yes stop_codon:yes gene_type:complete